MLQRDAELRTSSVLALVGSSFEDGVMASRQRAGWDHSECQAQQYCETKSANHSSSSLCFAFKTNAGAT
jgi:hypothetical protein